MRVLNTKSDFRTLLVGRGEQGVGGVFGMTTRKMPDFLFKYGSLTKVIGFLAPNLTISLILQPI